MCQTWQDVTCCHYLSFDGLYLRNSTEKSSPICLPSAVSQPKSGKGKQAMARRNTTDDRNELIACMETGNLSKASKLASGELPVFGKCDLLLFCLKYVHVLTNNTCVVMY